MTTHRICLLPGDGIGPEITAEAVKVLDVIGEQQACSFEFTEALLGGAAIDATGTALPEATLDGSARGRRRAARRNRRAQVGHHRPGQAAARAGAPRHPEGARALRQPAAGEDLRRAP